MSTLRDLQAAFAAHLAGDGTGEGLDTVVGDAISARARLQVHRNHVRHSLVDALAATFPTVQALVGAAFFRAMARAFVEHGLPEQPVLAEYGAGFPSFVAAWPPARGLPYLPDVARLDGALNAAWQSTDAGRLSAADLALVPAERLPDLSLSLSPGTGLLASDYPVDRIWRASQAGAGEAAVELDGGIDLLVLRQADDAAFLRLSAGEAAFLAALDGGERIEAAADRASGAQGDFDLSQGFARLLGLGCFAALQQ